MTAKPLCVVALCCLFAPASMLVAQPPAPEPLIVPAGADVFKSPGALNSEYDIASCMLPASYFEIGSPTLTGCELPLVPPDDPNDPDAEPSFPLRLQGVPLGSWQGFDVGNVDTIVQRLLPLNFGADPRGQVTVETPIELVALHMISADPIVITCDQGPTRWIAEVEVDEETGPSLGTMDVTLVPPHDGGSASSAINVCPRVTFNRIDPGAAGSFEVYPCDMLCGPELLGDTTWSFTSPDPDNTLEIEGFTTDNFHFTEPLSQRELLALEADLAKGGNTCNPDCPCVFKYPHLSETHRHQACLPCPCDADSAPPTVEPPAPITVECTQKGGTGRFDTCIDPGTGAGTLCIEDWLDDVSCADQPGDDPDKISSCLAFGPPSFFPAGCAPGQGTDVRFQGIDECCNEAYETSTLFVQDTLPPVVTPGEEDLYCLQPNSSAYVCFDRADFQPAIGDLCHEFDWTFVGCASDQPGGQGDNTDNDCQVACDGQRICVRAERTGGQERRYDVEIQPVDDCGNVGAATVIGKILVPASGGGDDSCIDRPAIHARCDAAPETGDAPLEVDFIDRSNTTGPPITSWLWDFGDGETSTDPSTTSHEYLEPGVYVPTLTVGTGADACFDLSAFTTCPEITVPLPPPTCTYMLLGNTAPLQVAFTGTSAVDGVTWSWDFDDGGTSGEQSPTWEYMEPGMYTPKVEISINGFTRETICDPIDVPPIDPTDPCAIVIPDFPPGGGGGNGFRPVPIVVTDPVTGQQATLDIDPAAILQSEEVDANGSGNTCPDAQVMTVDVGGEPSDEAAVRNESVGGGGGRIYLIPFDAYIDGQLLCSGEATVCARQGANSPCDADAGDAVYQSIPDMCPGGGPGGPGGGGGGGGPGGGGNGGGNGGRG